MNLKTTTLPSGLRVVSQVMDHAQTAALTVQVGAGSRHESEDEHGLAHLLEHMAFKGTRRRSARAIAEDIESVGGDLNAATATEQTSYLARVMPGDVGLALDIIADILRESTFEADELEREKGVILQEIGAAEDDPDDLVFDLFSAAAFPGQPIGRPILGTPARVRAFHRSAIVAYLDRHYSAPAIVVGAAGRVEHDELVEQIAAKFGSFPAHAGVAPQPARYEGGDLRLKRRQEQANIVVGFEGVAHGDIDHYAAHVFANAVGEGMSSPLFQEIREKRGLAYSIYSFHWSFEDTGLFGFHAATSKADAADLVAVAVDELAAATHDLSEAHIRRAKAQMKVGMLASMESSSSTAERIARQTALFGRVLSLDEVVARIDALTTGEVRAVGRRLLGSAPTIAAVGPVGRVPESDGVTARLAGL
jgi:predicted Zn-dependent peptidase